MSRNSKKMVKSMTGYAALTGAGAEVSWAWEMRSVNARGRDIRLRLPDWIDGLEPAVRKVVTEAVARGNLTLSLKVARDETVSNQGIKAEALSAALDQIAEVEAAATARGLSLGPNSAVSILGLRGVLESGGETGDTSPILAALMEDLPRLVKEFDDSRLTEGNALQAVLRRQLGEIAALVEAAIAAAQTQSDGMEASFRASLARVVDAVDVDPERIAQELAVLAVKADVTEEFDRLKAHVQAAEALLDKGGPVGRKLDFLTQEFNREANTLCSKSQSTEVTRIGLDLKTVIDQMREQVQNVE